MPTFTDEEWEEIGRAWLRAAGQDKLDRPDAISFVKWLKQSAYIKDYLCVPHAELPNAGGKFDPDRECILYRQDVWDSAERGDAAAIWTVWHEASHAIQKHQEMRFRSNAASKVRVPSRSGKDEFEANRLTACLAAPYDKSDFHPGTTVGDLCRRFGLSGKAAETRLTEFGRMYRRKNNINRDLPPGVVDFLTRQKSKGYSVQSIGDIGGMLPTAPTTYDGDPCPCCGEFRVVRQGLSRKCDCCGARLGDD
jgi:hypothetical protein